MYGLVCGPAHLALPAGWEHRFKGIVVPGQLSLTGVCLVGSELDELEEALSNMPRKKKI